MKNRIHNIKIDKLSKKYNENKVFDALDLEFEGGKITCIMGESGIGKTTLLKILMGLEKKDGGVISGIDETSKFSTVFQEDRLCEHLTAFGNVLMVCSKNILKDSIKEQLKQVLPEEAVLKKVSLLSGGMRQRVAIVRAMIVDSDIVFMDEPFKGLDEETKKAVIAYIKASQRGRTMLIITHNSDEADLLGAPICVLTKQ